MKNVMSSSRGRVFRLLSQAACNPATNASGDTLAASATATVASAIMYDKSIRMPNLSAQLESVSGRNNRVYRPESMGTQQPHTLNKNGPVISSTETKKTHDSSDEYLYPSKNELKSNSKQVSNRHESDSSDTSAHKTNESFWHDFVQNLRSSISAMPDNALRKRIPYQLHLAAASLVELFDHVDGWGIDDIAVGLAALWRLRVKNPQIQTSSVSSSDEEISKLWRIEHEEDINLVSRMRRFLALSHAAYAANIQDLSARSGLTEEDIYTYNFSTRAEATLPSYFLAVDHQAQSIVLAVRGTWSVDDVLLNVMAAPVEFNDGVAHRGMLQASEALLDKAQDEIALLSTKWPEYSLVTTGHSMGAAIAALTAIRLRKLGHQAFCYGFSPPACVSLELAVDTEPYIYSIIHGYDVTPRFHVAAMEQLRAELYAVDWQAEVAAAAKETWTDLAQSIARSPFIQSTLKRTRHLQNAVNKWTEQGEHRLQLLTKLYSLDERLRTLVSKLRKQEARERQILAAAKDKLHTSQKVTWDPQSIRKWPDMSQNFVTTGDTKRLRQSVSSVEMELANVKHSLDQLDIDFGAQLLQSEVQHEIPIRSLQGNHNVSKQWLQSMEESSSEADLRLRTQNLLLSAQSLHQDISHVWSRLSRRMEKARAYNIANQSLSDKLTNETHGFDAECLTEEFTRPLKDIFAQVRNRAASIDLAHNIAPRFFVDSDTEEDDSSDESSSDSSSDKLNESNLVRVASGTAQDQTYQERNDLRSADVSSENSNDIVLQMSQLEGSDTNSAKNDNPPSIELKIASKRIRKEARRILSFWHEKLSKSDTTDMASNPRVERTSFSGLDRCFDTESALEEDTLKKEQNEFTQAMDEMKQTGIETKTKQEWQHSIRQIDELVGKSHCPMFFQSNATNTAIEGDSLDISEENESRARMLRMQYYCPGKLYHLTYDTHHNDSNNNHSVQLVRVSSKNSDISKPKVANTSMPINLSNQNYPPMTRSDTKENSEGTNFLDSLARTHHRYFGSIILHERMISDHLAGDFENHFDEYIEQLRAI